MAAVIETLDSVNTSLRNTKAIIDSSHEMLARAELTIQALEYLNISEVRQLAVQKKIAGTSLLTLQKAKEADSIQKVHAAIRLKSTVDMLIMYGNEISFRYTPPYETLKVVVVQMLTLLRSQEDNSNLFLNTFLYPHWKHYEMELQILHFPTVGYGEDTPDSVHQRRYSHWMEFFSVLSSYEQDARILGGLSDPFYFPPADTSFLKNLRDTKFGWQQ